MRHRRSLIFLSALLPIALPSIFCRVEALEQTGACKRAQSAFAAEDFKSAAREYCHCIEDDPSNKEMYRARGLSYMGLGEFQKAKRDFETAGEPPGIVEEAQNSAITEGPDPDWLSALDAYHRGDHLMEIGKEEEAIAQYGDALAIRPQFPNCWDHMALALEKNGKESQAGKYLVKAISWRPRESETWAHLAGLLVKQGNMPASRDALLIAISLAPSEEFRGLLREALHRVNQAIEYQSWRHP